MESVASGLVRVSGAMGPMNRDLGPRIKAAVAASAELQERDALKSVGLGESMTTALLARGVPDATAHLAAELGLMAFKRGSPSGRRVTGTTTTSSRHIAWPRSTNSALRLIRWVESAVGAADGTVRMRRRG